MRRAAARRALTRGRGFTLLEVLVALVIVALGMSALLETLNESARNVMALRDKTVAEWIAMNQIALARLSLTNPTPGTSQGDVQNCANGNWHWQQQVNAIDAIPGLLSITVSVKRTGTAAPNPSQGHPAPAPGATPGATGQLGGNVSLGPTAALGSISAVNTAGCATFLAPGDSLGNGSGPGLGSMPSLGGASLGGASLGSATAASPGGSPTGSALGGSAAAGVANAVTGAGAPASASDSASNTGDNSGGWLVTVTGFRGNSLSVPSGEDPAWTGPGFAANSGGGAIPNPGMPTLGGRGGASP